MEEDNLVLASALLCLSTTTELARKRAIDTTIIHAIARMGIHNEFSIREVRDILKEGVPLRLQEIKGSVLRGLENGNLTLIKGTVEEIDSGRLSMSKELVARAESESVKIQGFLAEATHELLGDLYDDREQKDVERLLLDCLTRLMARYGYAYASQVTRE